MELVHVECDLSAWDPFMRPSGKDGLVEKYVDYLRAQRSQVENAWCDRNSGRSRSNTWVERIVEPAKTFGQIEKELELDEPSWDTKKPLELAGRSYGPRQP
jgi:hypothetical protein